jgi:uncharacterized protein YukE
MSPYDEAMLEEYRARLIERDKQIDELQRTYQKNTNEDHQKIQELRDRVTELEEYLERASDKIQSLEDDLLNERELHSMET